MTDWTDGNTETPESWVLDDQPGPAKLLSESASQKLVTSALDTHFGVQKPRAWPMWQVAAAVALVAVSVTGASAALRVWGRGPSAPVVQQAAPPATPTAVRPTQRPAPARVEPALPAEPPPAPDRVRNEKPRRGGAQDLLNRANALRGQREFQRAYQVYGRAIHASPHSQTAYVARIAAAALALDHLGKPARALEGYRAALEQDPHGVLAEEASFGVAESLRRLGRTQQERDALEAFLQAHPSSGLKERAERRLAELVPTVQN